jgi:hypothetical protein
MPCAEPMFFCMTCNAASGLIGRTNGVEGAAGTEPPGSIEPHLKFFGPDYGYGLHILPTHADNRTGEPSTRRDQGSSYRFKFAFLKVVHESC